MLPHLYFPEGHVMHWESFASKIRHACESCYEIDEDLIFHGNSGFS